jgi:hypothetical protein
MLQIGSHVAVNFHSHGMVDPKTGRTAAAVAHLTIWLTPL